MSVSIIIIDVGAYFGFFCFVLVVLVVFSLHQNSMCSEIFSQVFLCYSRVNDVFISRTHGSCCISEMYKADVNQRWPC